MGNIARKIKRKKEQEEKKSLEKKMSKKLNMFDMLPEQCLACYAKFDKKNKEQVTTWTVVVSEEKGRVSLFCPECVEKTKKGITNE
mgnify:CR=1 FL=1|tara:strand:+ start:523 stop:780 length:258 start_codon:yes stop_codon:yes gene_type:complete